MTSAVPEWPPDGYDPALKLVLEPSKETPARARAAVMAFCEQSTLTDEASATVRLLVSELVSNAVIHPKVGRDATIELFARLSPDLIRVEVVDQGHGFVPKVRPPENGASGYGLFLVDRQADRWGVDRTSGNRVWFEVAL